MTDVSRRSLLRGAGVAMAATALGGAAAGRASAATSAPAGPAGVAPAPPAAWRLRPFPLSAVALGAGVFAGKRSLMLAYGRGYDPDRLLQVFRANAGLSTRGAVAPGGWEGLDGEANGNLRGHYTGHFLTMLAQAYGSTGEEAFAEKIRYLVGALTEVRDALRRDPAVLSVPGRFARAAEQPRGSYQYIDLPATVLNGATAVTVAAWVRPAHDAAWTRILDIGTDTRRYLYLAARNQNGHPRFAITTTGAGGEQGVDGTAPLPLHTWSHVAVTLAGGVARLYVNGVQQGVNTAVSLTPASLGTPTGAWLGRSHYPADPVFAGAYSDVDIWSQALTAGQLAQLQTAPAAESAGAGDLASYGLQETRGGTFADASGRGRAATLRRTWDGPSHPGFLAAYPETQFSTLETMTSGNYTVVWAPYYTAHKILQGLLDAYHNTGDEQALDLAGGMGDWMYSRLSRLPASTLQRMWGFFSSGEYGGIVESICDLYRITGRAEHLALARLFDLNSLLDATAAGTDVIAGLHANQHIPIFTGALRLYDETGEQRYFAAARNFWPMVVPSRMYSIGGTSSAEFWTSAGRIAGSLSATNAETCCAYNMLKLSRLLFLHEQDPKYLDYYERALYNQVLGSKQDRADAEQPLVTYFIGLLPGHVRDYTPKQGTTCCEGTGMESATKYQDTVYLTDAAGSTLFVNLYSPSTLVWAAKGITVSQDTSYPYGQTATLTVNGRATFDLALRIPGWARDSRITVNGEPVNQQLKPGTYVRLQRQWSDGDTVRVELPFRLRAEPTPDDATVQSLCYGPVNLVARDPRTTYLPVSLYRNCALSGDLSPSLTPTAGKPLHFSLNGVEFAPFLEGTADPTHVYVRRSEPAVVFADRESGVANPARRGGTTLLDDIWAAAPFRDRAAFVAHVSATVDGWVGGNLLTAAAGEQVVATARSAPLVA